MYISQPRCQVTNEITKGLSFQRLRSKYSGISGNSNITDPTTIAVKFMQ